MAARPRTSTTAASRRVLTIGWREWVRLPDLDLPPFVAKIDTGARTSALHARRIRYEDGETGPMVSFLGPKIGPGKARRYTLPLLERRAVKNTSGVPESRAVVVTSLSMAGRRWRIEVTLTDRGNMGHELILGRTAIRRRRILVDAGRSFLTGEGRPAPGVRPAHPGRTDVAGPDAGAPLPLTPQAE